jgi:hypothetical protein
MEARVGAVLKQHKFVRFSDVMAEEELEKESMTESAKAENDRFAAPSSELATPNGKGSR